MDLDDELSQETIEDLAQIFDIDESLIKQFHNIQAKLSRLKIKFEAHKIALNNNYGHQRKS